LWQVLVPEKLWPRLQQCAEVIIIPDGALHLLPFETLVVKTGANEKVTRYWLDEGPVIRYAQSATTLYNIEKRPAARVIPLANQPAVLSLSDPIYDPAEVAALLQKQTDKRLTSQDTSVVSAALTFEELMRGLTRDSYVRFGGNLARLPGTARETAAIRKAFGAKGEVLELQQLAANEPKLRTGLSGKRYIHLATHGLVDERRQIIFSAFALTPPPAEKTVAEDDGFLQLFEIYDLKLPECELAVLSACRTNVGREYEGEGVFALSRGFLTAGSRRVIASQWSVDDVSTAELMGTFFQKIAAAEKAGQQIDYALALRDAKRRVRSERQWAAPYYWAPFILTGKR
jgi:CHAT domain-containing protein